jgi:hypothetical protein
MTIELKGALAFGLVIGYVTYRTVRRTKTSGLGDISAVIGAVGGGAVTLLFPTGSQAFGAYGIGLAIGFFVYLIISLFVARATTGLTTVNEWLGEQFPGISGNRPPAATTTSRGRDIPALPGD